MDIGVGGGIVMHWLPEDEPERPTCSLDAAELGGLSRLETATLLGITGQRLDQIEFLALRKARKRLKRGDYLE